MTQPTRRIRYLRRHFPNALARPALDVGCGDFVHLRNFAPGSVGMDGRTLTPPAGYHFLHWNFEDDIGTRLAESGLPSTFETIWCSDVFEHTLNPHPFLLNLRRTLSAQGLLFLGVPLVNPLAFRKLQTRTNIFNYFCGYLSQDHVNFFTYRTLRHTVEFAGFETVAWYSPFIGMRRPPMTGLEPVTVLALRKTPGWNYPPKAYKFLDEQGHLRWKQYLEGQPD